MSVWEKRHRLFIEGIMPQRALLRFKRAGIAVYNAKKPQKNQLVFSVKEKDVEKVFAIYPKVCYNGSGKSAYVVSDLGGIGLAKPIEWAKRRIGFLLGAMLFCVGTLYVDSYVFGVELKGTHVYRREVEMLLEEYGVKPFSRYKGGNEDVVCARLLSLDGVEFCSVKKSGLRVVVEMRLSPFAKRNEEKGDMKAKHTGTLLTLTALKGTALKRVGDSVQVGEPLVGGYFLTESGEGKQVIPIARASIACTYEAELSAYSEEEAFAQAYLNAGLADSDTLTEKHVEVRGGVFYVKLAYTAIESINL